MDKKDIKFTYTRGKGPGGQHRNKTDSCVTALHLPTGIKVRVDGRDQQKNKKQAIRNLEKAINEAKNQKLADQKKEHRDFKIHNTEVIRTYNYKRQTVKDHRSNKTAPLGKFMSGQVIFGEFSNE